MAENDFLKLSAGLLVAFLLITFLLPFVFFALDNWIIFLVILIFILFGIILIYLFYKRGGKIAYGSAVDNAP